MARSKKSQPETEGNVTRAHFLEVFDELTSALRLKASADSAVASVYKRAERTGLDRKQLKRAYAESLKATDEREMDDRRYRQYLEWLGKPVGFQPDLPIDPAGREIDPEADAAEDAAVAKHELNVAFTQGANAGKAGAAMASDPYAPGTEQHQQWSLGWSDGQKEAVQALGGVTRRRAVPSEGATAAE